MTPDTTENLIVLLATFIASLLGVVLLFTYLKVGAEASPRKITGALAGFLIVFGLLYGGYSRLEKNYYSLFAVLLLHGLSLIGSWVLFKRLSSSADIILPFVGVSA